MAVPAVVTVAADHLAVMAVKVIQAIIIQVVATVANIRVAVARACVREHVSVLVRLRPIKYKSRCGLWPETMAEDHIALKTYFIWNPV